MAFNPRGAEFDKRRDLAITDLKPKADVAVDKVELKNLGEKIEYYMEWWEIGTPHNNIEIGYFRI